MRLAKSFFLLITICTIKVSCSYGQSKYPQQYFRSPIDFPIILAGNFGEIRSNHFHGGLDIKTESIEGKHVYAAADGYVSRIKISPWGYGKTLYITHPNGYITVYAHLKKLEPKLDEYIKRHQYKKQMYSVQKFPYSNELKVKKGDLIAYSGNTGGSSGPHLHFEIRNAITGFPVNPLLFGFAIMDSLKPSVKALRIYPLNENSHINGSHNPKYIGISGSKGKYHVKGKKPITVRGEVGFAIEVYDFLNYSHNKCGIFSIELKKDGKRVYYHEMATYGFHENHYISSHVDYSEFKRKGKHLQKSFIAPNNRLSIYKESLNRGVVNFSEDGLHEMEYIIKDSYGNTSTLYMTLQSKREETMVQKNEMIPGSEKALLPIKDTGSTKILQPNRGGMDVGAPSNLNLLPKFTKEDASPHYVKTFKYQFENSYSTDEMKVYLSSGLLYEDLDFNYKTSDTILGAIAPTHHIHNPYTPVHGRYSLSIKPKDISEKLKVKALIVRVNKYGSTYYEGGAYEGEFITANPKYLGAFTVLIDSIPPKIRALNVYQGKDMTPSKSIKVNVYDKLSGIASFNGYIDGQWILMEYEPKNAALTYNFDDLEKFTPNIKGTETRSTHKFELEVTDNRGNISKLAIDFLR
ncbi:MAG TPA: M23 family metallopeptidase [Flavobacteriales bacterium]|nr:M23 family metallopeptidase [Flavobacteriales bacterium]